MARTARTEHDLQSRVAFEKLDHVENGLGQQGSIVCSVWRVGQVDVRVVDVALGVERDKPARLRIEQQHEGRERVGSIVLSTRRAGAVRIRKDFNSWAGAGGRGIQN